MKLTLTQKKVANIIAFAIGIISLFLFFKGLYLWAGIAFILMGCIGIFTKRQAAELIIVIGLAPILIYFGLMRLMIAWSIIIMLVGLYDFLMVLQIREDMKANGNIKDQKAFNESFRQKELIHVLFTKLIKCLGIKNPAGIE
jgi:hypothetical protein